MFLRMMSTTSFLSGGFNKQASSKANKALEKLQKGTSFEKKHD
jgi:hypothetical protein